MTMRGITDDEALELLKRVQAAGEDGFRVYWTAEAKRCLVLATHGMLRLGAVRGLYHLTPRGTQFLDTATAAKLDQSTAILVAIVALLPLSRGVPMTTLAVVLALKSGTPAYELSEPAVRRKLLDLVAAGLVEFGGDGDSWRLSDAGEVMASLNDPAEDDSVKN